MQTLYQVMQFAGLNAQYESKGTFNKFSPWRFPTPDLKSRNIDDLFSMKVIAGESGNKERWTEEMSADELHRQSAYIGAAVDRFFPTFESSSGWQLQSAYSPLPSNLQAELTRFFKPYNNLLSQLLDTDYFNQEWADRGTGVGHNNSLALRVK